MSIPRNPYLLLLTPFGFHPPNWGMGSQSVLQIKMLSHSSFYNDTSALRGFLWLAALAWGLTIGALIHAFWRGPLAGDERGRRAWGNSPQIWSFYIVPTLLQNASENARPQPNDRETVRYISSHFDAMGRNYSLMMNTCEPLQKRQLVSAQADNCFYARTDGFLLVEKLKALTKDLDMHLVGAQQWPIERRGNTISGNVHLLAKGYGRERLPVTLSYRGLVYMNRQGQLSPTEKWLETELFNGIVSSYAQMRAGHD